MQEAERVAGVVLAGVHGHGRHHLRNLARLAARPTAPGVRIRLAGLCDTRPPEADLLMQLQSTEAATGLPPQPELHVGSDLEAVLDAVQPLVTIICTPIHTHVDLTLRALSRGSHVLLEKPPAATFAEYQRLLDGAAKTGPAVQIGFQSLGSAALPHVRGLIADGAIGELTLISAACAWARDESYYARAAWAGRRRLDGLDVVDGVLTNPLAHAVANALLLDGSDGSDRADDIEVELYRANDIEADDTSVVRLRTPAGTRVTVAATLCAEVQLDPVIVLHGTHGRIEYAYKRSHVRLIRPDHPTAPEQEWTLPSDDLLENLVRHALDPTVELLVPPAATRSFMDVLEAVRTAPDPTPIDATHTVVKTDGGVRRVVLPGIESLADEAARTASLFRELGVPWANRPAPARRATSGAVSAAGDLPTLATLRLAGTEVARYLDGAGLPGTLAPRPFLHPVRTLSGVPVSDERPADHPWHLGVCVAVQDVSGNNLWGGRTYVRGQGYTWRADHGRIWHLGFTDRSPEGFTADLVWTGADGNRLLREQRVVTARSASDPLPDTPPDTRKAAGDSREALRAWILTWRTTLTAVAQTPVSLGSPSTNGRDGGGYGGFFWRLPAMDAMTIDTPTAAGEQAAHGTRAAWLAVHGRVGAADVTLVAAGLDDVTRRDAWFVRSQGYPGFGSSLAVERPVLLQPGEQLRRSFAVVIADGTQDPAALALLAGPTAVS